MARFNRILHNLCTDVWTYISLGYFAQVRGQGTVGSSTMPHKVNPIRFENAEANLEVEQRPAGRAGLDPGHSRLQRDLTDSSMQRNIGTRVRSLAARDRQRPPRASPAWTPCPGAGRRPRRELGGARRAGPVGDAGARRAGVPGMEKPYERLKELTRGRRVDADDLREFVRGLGLPAEVEARFVALTPADLHGARRPARRRQPRLDTLDEPFPVCRRAGYRRQAWRAREARVTDVEQLALGCPR